MTANQIYKKMIFIKCKPFLARFKEKSFTQLQKKMFKLVNNRGF